jgi:6-phosphogluconate dehydrogenase
MQIGMIGLGRMGANMVRRLMRDGHECVVYDHATAAIEAMAAEGAIPAHSLAEMNTKLPDSAPVSPGHCYRWRQLLLH